MAKQVFFYGTHNDLREVISVVESENNFSYHLAGLLEKENMVSYSSLYNEPFLGTAKVPNQSFCDRFIVLYAKTPLNIREVEQAKGGIKFAIDQLKNPKSILFWPCGRYDPGSLIIEGNISTVSIDLDSHEIFNTFSKAIKKMFLKFKNLYIGRDAHELYRKGWRLTQNKDLPHDLDFNIT